MAEYHAFKLAIDIVREYDMDPSQDPIDVQRLVLLARNLETEVITGDTDTGR